MFCGEPLPYTGNICDYPWLFNADGNLDLYNISQFYVLSKFDTVALWASLGSPAYGTWMFPDMNNDGIISETDYIALVNGMFFLGAPTVDCTDIPPGITKPSVRKRAIFAKAVKALAEKLIPKAEMQKLIRKR